MPLLQFSRLCQVPDSVTQASACTLDMEMTSLPCSSSGHPSVYLAQRQEDGRGVWPHEVSDESRKVWFTCLEEQTRRG